MAPLRLTLLLMLLLACSRPEPGPPWAAGMTAEDARHLVQLVEAHFRAAGQEAEVESGVVSLPAGKLYRLADLARTVAREPRSAWPARVHEHFQALERAEAARVLPPLDAVRDRILLRLVPESFAAEHPGAVLRKDLEGTATALVVELEDSVRFLVPDDLERWQVSAEELFAVGAQNLTDYPFPKPEVLELENLGPLKLVSGESPFISSLALQLGRHPELTGQHGALVALPSRNLLLAYPVDDLSAMGALHRLALMVTRLDEEGPDAVTSELFYFDGQKLARIPYKLHGSNFQVTPPPELSEALRRMRAGREAGPGRPTGAGP